MPFTPAHAAAALLFRRTRFFGSALVTGCVAPDLEYFVRLRSGGGFGHTVPGLFLLDLPMGLAALWLFHACLREPLWALLPRALRMKLPPRAASLKPRNFAHFLLICASILLGGITHLAWDSFTHSQSWLVDHWGLLQTRIPMPLAGSAPLFGVLQIVCSVLGLAILFVWLWFWFRDAKPRAAVLEEPYLVFTYRRQIRLGIIIFSMVCAGLWAFAGTGVPRHRATMYYFVSDALISMISSATLALLVCGIVSSLNRSLRKRQWDQPVP